MLACDLRRWRGGLCAALSARAAPLPCGGRGDAAWEGRRCRGDVPGAMSGGAAATLLLLLLRLMLMARTSGSAFFPASGGPSACPAPFPTSPAPAAAPWGQGLRIMEAGWMGTGPCFRLRA